MSTNNALSGLGGMLDDVMGGFDDFPFFMLPIDSIEVKAQVREEFEDEDNSLEEMAESIRLDGVFQPILVRPLDGGGYELVAGERRLRASVLAGKDTIPVYSKAMTDEQAERIQFAENIQRKNLTMIEEAARLQKRVDSLGSTALLLAEINKSDAWLSKRLSLLKLPEQAKRLIKENISADIEVINAVAQVEKHSPEKARETVEKLKTDKGKSDARKTVKKAKDEVKPKKEPKPKTELPKDVNADLTTPQIETRVTEFCFTKHKKTGAVVEFLASFKSHELEALENLLAPYHSKGVSGDIGYSMSQLHTGAFGASQFAAVRYAAFTCGLGGLPCDPAIILGYVVDYVSKSL